MPAGNRRGPNNEGPATGRAMGYCAGNDRPGCETAGPRMGRNRGNFGRGAGRGAPGSGGRGRGWRNRYFATGQPGWERDLPEGAATQQTVDERLAALEDEIKALRRQQEQ